jgi:hypothetical protein
MSDCSPRSAFQAERQRVVAVTREAPALTMHNVPMLLPEIDTACQAIYHRHIANYILNAVSAGVSGWSVRNPKALRNTGATAQAAAA